MSRLLEWLLGLDHGGRRMRLKGADVMTALDEVPQQTRAEDNAYVDERTPGVVPGLAVDVDPRPRQVQGHQRAPQHREDVDRQPPAAHGEVAALLEILWRPLALEPLLQHR